MRNFDKLRYVSSENAQFVFWHPFIYICAFHFLFHKNPALVMKQCNVDAILQLVRPKEVTTSYFEVAADDECVILFIERMRYLGIKREYANHPLFQKMFTEMHMVTGATTIAMEMVGVLNVIEKVFREDISPTIIELNE